jgi:hypothetical protein
MNEIEFRNMQIVNLTQAMLGCISLNFRSVVINVNSDCTKVTFVLEKENKEDFEEIEDIIFEYEALQITNTIIKKHILITNEDISRVIPQIRDSNGLIVFQRKE